MHAGQRSHGMSCFSNTAGAQAPNTGQHERQTNSGGPHQPDPTVMTRVEDVTPEERDRRMAEWVKENA
jgi:hypothetical protein